MIRVVLILSLVTISLVNAQHDPGRNTVRLIATDKLDDAEKLLPKPPKRKNSPISMAEQQYVLSMIAVKRGNIDQAFKYAREAVKSGLPIERYQAESHYLFKELFKHKDFQKLVLDPNKKQLLHGPMIGGMSDTSASFWVRTADEASVKIVIKNHAPVTARSSKNSDYTAIIKVQGLKAETEYEYSIFVNDKLISSTGKFTTYPESGQEAKIRVAFGGGAGFTTAYEHMWTTLHKQKLNALLLLGDNVYIDDPEHQLTNRYCYYRRQSHPDWKKLVGSAAVYTIYDDHDFGMNDCIPGPDIDKPAWKRDVWKTFSNNWNNPAYGGGTKQPGCWYDFYIGDVHFIALDCRYYRDLKGGSMLGPVQKAWLFDTLKSSKGKFKIIASSVPWSPGVKPGSKDTWDGFAKEREEIFSFIEKNRLEGIVLMAADRHRSDMRKIKRPNGYDFYEVMSSRLTNVHTHSLMENAKGSEFIMGYNKKCSFGLLNIDTKASDPLIKYTMMSIDNEAIESRTIKLSELKYK